jgi:phospholipid/cholesterol/gamma-HCH transport system ATP-binding protein
VPEDVLIRVEDFTAAYEGAVVIDVVSFEVRRGEVFVILAARLREKHAVKHMIAACIRRERADSVDGEDIAAAHGEARRQILRRLADVSDGRAVGSMSLLENVRRPLEEFTSLPPRRATAWR